MAKLKEFNGKYCESEFEYAFLSFLEADGWHIWTEMQDVLAQEKQSQKMLEDAFRRIDNVPIRKEF